MTTFPPAPDTKTSENKFFGYGVLIAAMAYLLVASYYVEHGLFNGDEGFYVVVAHEAAHGKMPYRDFAYTQMPLLPYLHGAIMSLTGFGVREQRWINSAWSALALALAVGLWQSMGVQRSMRTVLIATWCLCLPLVYYNTIGKTYSLAQFWVLAAGACLFLRVTPTTKLLFFSIAGVIAIGCRLTVAPLIGILWLGLCTDLHNKISRPLLVGVPVLAGLGVLGPFFFADLENAMFCTWEIHVRGTLPRHHFAALWKSITLFPSIALFLSGGFVAWFKTSHRPQPNPAFWLVLASSIGWVFSVAVPGTWVDYATPCLLLGLTGAGILLADLFNTRPTIARCVAATAALFTAVGIFRASDLARPGYLRAVDQTASYVRNHTQAGDVILSSMAEIPLEAGRDIIPGLELGHFGVTTEMDETRAARRRMVTFNRLLETIENRRVPMIVLSQKKGANFTYSIPNLIYIEAYPKFVALLGQYYTSTYSDDYFVVYQPIHSETPAIRRP